MSLREVSSSTPFLAKKGGAAPANPSITRGGPAEPSLRPIESDGEISLESAPTEATADHAASAAGKRTVEAAPAASLLPFDLLRRKYRPDVLPDLAEDEPDITPTDFIVTLKPEPKPQAELALRAKPEVAASLTAESGPSPAMDDKFVLDMPTLKVNAPRTDVSYPDAPHPDAPRTDVSYPDAPALAPSLSPKPDWRPDADTDTDTDAGADTHTHAVAQSSRTSSGGWLLPFGALAAAFTALVVGWNMTNPDFDLDTWLAPVAAVVSKPVDEVAQPTAVDPPPPIVETPAPTASSAPAEPEVPILPENIPPENIVPDNAPVEPDAAAPTPLQASLPEPVLSPPVDSAGTPAESTTQGEPAPPAAAEPTNTAPTSAAPIAVKPTVDVVRLEANGEAVIAGRAAPNTELIVLDNGEPIGTVQVDAYGEWVFVPEEALPPGDHEFGLVIKTVQESVNMPAPTKPSLPPAPEVEVAPEGAPEAALAVPKSDPVESADNVSEPEIPDVLPAINDAETAAQPIPVPVPKPESTDASSAPVETPVDTPAEPSASSQQGAPAADTADFVVQLASVKTRAGAEQEWRKLKQKFPVILSDMAPTLDEVELADYGTVIRVRTGAFDSQHAAAVLCSQLAEKSQACFVVKTTGGN